jgi:hypothetical protein
MIGRIIGRILFGFIAIMGIAAAAAAVAKRSMVSEGDAGSNEVTLAAIFEPVAFESRATAFRGGSLLCWFGGGSVDLRGATLDPAGARLTVRAIFGGGVLVVPEDWDVELRVVGILGGVGDSRGSLERPGDSPRLVVDGFAFFGGFGISSEPPRRDD